MASSRKIDDTTAPTTRPGLERPKRNTGALTIEASPVSAPGSAKPLEANVIVIAHPDPSCLGSRYRLRSGSSLEIGRSPELDISFPEQLSVSRRHARFTYVGHRVLIEDLGSLNGTFVNDRPVDGQTALVSGDRIQVGKVHLKFLHEQDVEHAFHEAIYQLAIRDGLTELFNRRKFTEDLETEFLRARRHQRPFALVVFDIDRFKEINDKHGHLGGDAILKRMAQAARDMVRQEQVLARIGGEEFGLLCPETALEGARQLAEKMRSQVERLRTPFGGLELAITCSFGVAAIQDAIASAEDLFEAADRALYRAKEAGRNCVVAAEA